MTQHAKAAETLRRFIDHHGYVESDRRGEERIPYSDEDAEAMLAVDTLVALLDAEIARATENGRLARTYWDRAQEAEARIAAARLLLDPDRQDEPDEENALRAFEVLTTCPECGSAGEHGLGCPKGPHPMAFETMRSENNEKRKA